jgi:hypothetical protein
MKPYKFKPSQEYKTIVRNFLKQFNVPIHYRKSSSHYCDGDKIVIDFDAVSSIQILWSTVFHELAHILCFKLKLYEKYHYAIYSKRKEAIYMRRYGLRAERFVDKKGSVLMRKFLPKIPYSRSYVKKQDCQWFRDRIAKMYPIERQRG